MAEELNCQNCGKGFIPTCHCFRVKYYISAAAVISRVLAPICNQESTNPVIFSAPFGRNSWVTGGRTLRIKDIHISAASPNLVGTEGNQFFVDGFDSVFFHRGFRQEFRCPVYLPCRDPASDLSMSDLSIVILGRNDLNRHFPTRGSQNHKGSKLHASTSHPFFYAYSIL